MLLLISREQAENALRDALRLFVGRHRRYSVERFTKGIGLYKSDGMPNTKAIYDFISYPSSHPDHRPLHFGVILSATSFLGAEFTNEWLRLAHQGAFELPDEDPNPGDLAADNCDDSAAIVRAAKDGTFANDRDILPAVGSRMMQRGALLVAVGGRR
jgi:hypothetical protein